MKKLLGVLCILGLTGTVKASVSEKVVELHITRADVVTVETSKHSRLKVPIRTDRHFVCSGGFIDGNGNILTAKHCTEDVELINILTSDNQIYKGTVIATSELQDLAVIHIDRRDTPFFVIASSVTQGESISTLGSPLALRGTQSWGKVARLSGDLILMDESILPGNSGGIVFNNKGQLVGVAVSVSIVGYGVTHLAQAQGADSIVFFLRSIKKELDQYITPKVKVLKK